MTVDRSDEYAACIAEAERTKTVREWAEWPLCAQEVVEPLLRVLKTDVRRHKIKHIPHICELVNHEGTQCHVLGHYEGTVGQYRRCKREDAQFVHICASDHLRLVRCEEVQRTGRYIGWHHDVIKQHQEGFAKLIGTALF